MSEFYIDNNDVVRWKTSNQVPFDDMLTKFLLEDLICQEQVLRSMSARKVEADIAIQQYVENRQEYGYSDEEKFEMQAAFGGEEVVDIFTGKVVAYN
jgi:hypothetical protein